MNTKLRTYLSKQANTAVCNVWFTLIYYSQFVTTINFIYRYIGVVWERPLGVRKYLGMLASLMLVLAIFFIWDFVLTVPTDAAEYVMSENYVKIFGGPNVTNKEELRTCNRGDMVIKL